MCVAHTQLGVAMLYTYRASVVHSTTYTNETHSLAHLQDLIPPLLCLPKQRFRICASYPPAIVSEQVYAVYNQC